MVREVQLQISSTRRPELSECPLYIREGSKHRLHLARLLDTSVPCTLCQTLQMVSSNFLRLLNMFIVCNDCCFRRKLKYEPHVNMQMPGLGATIAFVWAYVIHYLFMFACSKFAKKRNKQRWILSERQVYFWHLKQKTPTNIFLFYIYILCFC